MKGLTMFYELLNRVRFAMSNFDRWYRWFQAILDFLRKHERSRGEQDIQHHRVLLRIQDGGTTTDPVIDVPPPQEG